MRSSTIIIKRDNVPRGFNNNANFHVITQLWATENIKTDE